jgi:ATP-dependent DNA helicase DinG
VEISQFNEEVIQKIQTEIHTASGNEVFFVGNFDEDFIINEIRVLARGNEYSVPAIIDSASAGQVVFHNHPSGNLTPSDQDIHLASIFGNNGVGFLIINNSVTNIYSVVEPFRKKEYLALDISELEKLLMPKGPVAKKLGKNFEHRKEQIKVLNETARSFNEDSIALIEAGTGTGKTFSYLIPAIKWALKNNERVVVSTNTINLQEQLIGKDIPMLEEAIQGNFTYSLVKGMRNYLCILRAGAVDDGQQELIEDEESDEIKNILDWSKTTSDGSLSDLSFSPKPNIWDKVSAESDSCIRNKCPHYADCFFFKKRREVSAAQLLIVNHHLFFSDLAIKAATNDSESGILPAYNRVIFDEAHNIVDAATSHFSMTVSKFGLIRTLRRLKSRGKKGEIKGLVNFAASTANKISKNDKNGELINTLFKIEEVVSPRIDIIETSINESFEMIYDIASANTREDRNDGNDFSFRVLEHIQQSDDWLKAEEIFESLRIKLLKIQGEIKFLIEILGQNEEMPQIIKLLIEFRSVYSKMEYYLEGINSFFKQKDDQNVKWVEVSIRKGNVFISLGISPIDISNQLKQELYNNTKTVVMTSATLAVENSFEFQKSQLGLENNPRTRQKKVLSPFNYKKQVVLGMPVNIPEHHSSNYIEVVSKILQEVIEISGGRALILFTSYNTLNSVTNAINEGLLESGIEVLKQGTLPRDKLLDKFRNSMNAVLLATDSFWEGVDIIGDALKLVVIMRLPFKVPTDPIIEARADYLEKMEINSFLNYSVPMAVIKFKQGFGRLIRSKNDRGAVLVLDKRISTKSYGKYFINSLPECNKIYGNYQDMLNKLKEFI